MKLRFTKMHGAGNDFVMVDGVRQKINLSANQWRFLADRHFGVGADQMLLVEPATVAQADFDYRIFNADGGEVEHCGNGARCFVRFVNEIGLTQKSLVTVHTKSGILQLERVDQERVKVDMGRPRLSLEAIPFRHTPEILTERRVGQQTLYCLQIQSSHEVATIEVGLVSMGNPHAIVEVANARLAEVDFLGPQVQALDCFPSGVNVGFMQILNRQQIALRVFERGVGETFACGTGACAAVAHGVLVGSLDEEVEVLTRGGKLRIEWQQSDPTASILMTGPTKTVFHGEIELPTELDQYHEQSLP